MILVLPVQDGHEMTKVCLDQLAKSVNIARRFTVLIVDNASDKPYHALDYTEYPFRVHVMRVSVNNGYYYPLKVAAQFFGEANDNLIGLMHNDMLLYEVGWNVRMEDCFIADEKLGLIGLCGSSEIDALGGRGGGTMCHFAGRQVQVGNTTFQGQPQDAGRRIHGLEPSLCLDSLFMMFRREVIPTLVHDDEKWEDLTLAHFYDRIWPIRTIEAGYRVATLGVECDHIGGLTTTGNERYRQDCIKWLDARKIPWREDESGVIAAEREDDRNKPCGNPETQMYLVAEDRYLKEYRDEKKFLPAIIGGDYEIQYLAR